MNAKYICLRFFIVPVEEHLFAKPVPDAQKLDWFKKAFLTNRTHALSEDQEFAVRVTDREDQLRFGKLSKRTMHQMHDLKSDDVEDVVKEDWPYLEFMVDLTEGAQALVIEYKSAVVYKVSAMKTTLEAIVNGPMFQHGYAVKFEPILDDKTFWGIVNDAPGIYSVTFSLNSPNLFGAKSSANEALKEIRNVFNNTRTDITVVNDRGNLKLPHDNVETYREYAD